VTSSGRAELGRKLVERAYLEGDFVLRSGRRSRYYLDKYRFETEPELLAGLGRELAAMVRDHAPGAALLAGPELGAVPLAAAERSESVRNRQPARGGLGPGGARLRDRGRGHVGGCAAVRHCGSQSRKPRRLCCNCRG
jgi:hypothetical protein